MIFLRKNRIEIRILVFSMAFLMVSQSVAVLAEADRIYPTNKVTLYRGDKVVGVYTKEAPLPEGSIISTDGRCAVKLDDLYLVGEDQSEFSINTAGRQRNLFIKKGTVYFKTSAMTRSFSFITPDGPISVQSIQLNAAAGGSSLKGLVTVTESRSELGVVEGGSMIVSTDKGLMTIQSGKKIILSQADMDIGLPEVEEPAAEQPPADKQPQESKPRMSRNKKIVYGTLGAVAVVGIALGLGGSSGGDGGGSVSPSTP